MKKLIITLSIIIILMIVVLSCMYTVKEDEHVCILRFAKIVDIQSEPGLYFKIPFIDSKLVYPKPVQLYDINPSDVYTMDKKAMEIDSYVLWKIQDPQKFNQTITTISAAESRLEAIAYNFIKVKMGNLNQEDIINMDPPQERNAIYEEIYQNVRSDAEAYGIEVVDVKVKRFDLPTENEEAVYARMISDRKEIAAEYTAGGALEANKIINETDKTYNKRISDAQVVAEKTIAEGESEYMKILASTYDTQEKKDFYYFLRSLEALKLSLNGNEKTVILGADSELAKILLKIKPNEPTTVTE